MQQSVEAIVDRIGSNCEAARLAWDDAHEWVQRWQTLVFVVGTAVVITIVVALGFLIAGNNGAAVAGGAGTVVTGAAMGFVLKQRNDARADEKLKQAAMNKICPT
jgi:hypothetical protein